MNNRKEVAVYRNFKIYEATYHDDYPAWFTFSKYAYYHEGMEHDEEGLSYTYGWANTIEKCKEQIDDAYDLHPELIETKPCPECNGRGWIAWSCCGDDISLNDFDNCPSCMEHCGTEKDSGEDCEFCEGSGKVPIEIKTEQQ